MKILAIDTTGQTASAAIVEEDKLIAEFTLNYKLTHSQTILPMIDEICEKSETKPGEVDYIACACGPGSFTGLRIGAATVKGLALALGKELVPVPTLDALAYNVFETENIICPIMDARRSQVYTAFYHWENGKLCRLTEMLAISIEEVLRMAEGYGQKVIFLGDGVPVHRDRLSRYPDFLYAPAHCSLQRAASVAALAMVLAREGKAVAGNAFELIYLRKSQAEREREAHLQGEGEKND
ncbi:tRNA threonylcarbamoyladenosine biosynthesis protein TsaB [Anaerotignum neopropionicum]|uniref:tRNA threonylcarbamoyladenosine biosynthesis protein TsaB n=1 Tax=Anaerotignum neopropionicum TaxID=36847 RepID=A0A136WJF7_9FIRM|nr:tRNA (adenosine(37)-N6)-threonylcarbamoyltransferase complex dimerization subunit type 1 TsaB [Anaerotignum neopropionicum]KXL54530.1 tRNA threonylcarbamoyladenosine biosynthesis protein TsaB [Anaerotignum neopropionicum]